MEKAHTCAVSDAMIWASNTLWIEIVGTNMRSSQLSSASLGTMPHELEVQKVRLIHRRPPFSVTGRKTNALPRELCQLDGVIGGISTKCFLPQSNGGSGSK